MNFEVVADEIRNYLLSAPWLEFVAIVSSLLYTILAAREKIICWFFGFISSAIYLYICFTAKLYQDMIINFYYILAAVYGWVLWNRKDRARPLIIKKINPLFFTILLASTALVAGISGYLFSTHTDASFPYLDAICTFFAFTATWMQAKKLLENWLVFLAVDFVCIFLFGMKGLYFTSLLYFIYTIICIIAYLEWRKKIRTSSV